MPATLLEYAERLRRPAHTGPNRCWPCTAVNLVLVGLLGALCLRRDRRLAGAVALVGGVVAIALRGYVVPYTPAFAPKLVAASPVPDDLFGKPRRAREERASLTATELEGENVLRTLASAGALETDGDVVRPTEAVDRAWRREMDRLADRPLAEAAAIAAEDLPHVTDAEPYDDGRSAWLVVDGDLVAYPVAVAELAAYGALRDHVGNEAVRLAGASAFRMFLEHCPVCDTALAESSAVSCCGGYTDPRETPAETLVCPTCEQRLFTM